MPTFCPHCGAMQPDGIAKCANCGQPMPAPAPKPTADSEPPVDAKEIAEYTRLTLRYTLVPVLIAIAVVCVALLVCSNLPR